MAGDDEPAQQWTLVESVDLRAVFVGDGRPELDIGRSGILDGVEYVLNIGRGFDVDEFSLRRLGRAVEFVRRSSGVVARTPSRAPGWQRVVDDALDGSRGRLGTGGRGRR